MTTIQHVRRAVSRLVASPGRTTRWPVMLGTGLLIASTAGVFATQNTPVEIASMTISGSAIKEGDTLTLSVAFADPDAQDLHSAYVNWGDHRPRQLLRFSNGERAFQITHTYVDDQDDWGSTVESVGVHLVDHQQPFDANDNLDGQTEDLDWRELKVANVAPTFSGNVAVTKSRPKPNQVLVKLTGAIADPGTADTHEVFAATGSGPKVSLTAGTPCTVTDRRFQCEVPFTVPATPSPPSTTQAITLVVKDDDGGEGKTVVTVQVP
jgi:hypothetical protein